MKEQKNVRALGFTNKYIGFTYGPKKYFRETPHKDLISSDCHEVCLLVYCQKKDTNL